MLDFLKDFFTPFTNLKAVSVIVLVGFIIYFNSLFNGFAWDDIPFILSNNEVHSIDIAKIIGLSKFNIHKDFILLYN